MADVDKKLRARVQFEEETRRRRQEERHDVTDVNNDVPPVFNKHHYSARGTVVITDAARCIMDRNANSFGQSAPRVLLTTYERSVMQGVTDVLKLVHRGVDYVRDVLSYVVTMETYEPYCDVTEKDHEDVMSCYYIVYGLVEVTYDEAACSASSVQMFEPNIVYTNGSGEYLGLVSQDGPAQDMTSPASIYTKANCLMLRVDRQGFHRLLEKTGQELEQEKWDFMNSDGGPLSHLTHEEKTKLVPACTKMIFNPHKVLARQDQVSDVLYIIVTGHCYCVRSVWLSDARMTYLMRAGQLLPGYLVGGETLMEPKPYHCTVYSSTYTTCYKFHRRDLEALSKDSLIQLQKRHLTNIPDDETLQNKGYRTTAWRRFKQHQVELVKEKHGVRVRPLHLPTDVRWGTISPQKLHSQLFIAFLAGEENPDQYTDTRHDTQDDDSELTESGVTVIRLARPISAHPAKGKHPVYSVRRQKTKSAPTFRPRRQTRLPVDDCESTEIGDDDPNEDGHDVSDDVVHDRATYSSLGARDIVRQATEMAEIKSRRRGSTYPNKTASSEKSLFSSIADAHETSTSHVTDSKCELETLRKRLERAKLRRRQMEEERMRKNTDKEFKMALRRPQMRV